MVSDAELGDLDSCLIFMNGHMETDLLCCSREQSLDLWDGFTGTILASYKEALSE